MNSSLFSFFFPPKYLKWLVFNRNRGFFCCLSQSGANGDASVDKSLPTVYCYPAVACDKMLECWVPGMIFSPMLSTHAQQWKSWLQKGVSLTLVKVDCLVVKRTSRSLQNNVKKTIIQRESYFIDSENNLSVYECSGTTQDWYRICFYSVCADEKWIPVKMRTGTIWRTTKTIPENVLYTLYLILKRLLKIHIGIFLESMIANGYQYQPQADCLARFSRAVKVNKSVTI